MKILNLPDLYTADGLFINLPAVLSLGYKYTVIISLRGGGKTYGYLDYSLTSSERFMYFRRNEKSLRLAVDKEFHIYKELNMNRGRNIQPRMLPKIGIGQFMDMDDGEIIGYAANLGTFASVRSIGNVKTLGLQWLVFDEFIPQPDEIRRYDLYKAWSNAEETLVRNTAITGGSEVRRLLMANSDTIYGDIVTGYRIGDAYMEMQERGIEVMEYSPDMVLLRPGCAKLADLKANTALYRVTAGSEFSDIALGNKFLIEDRPHIKRKNLQEYVAVAAINGICIYRHKGRSEWYVSETVSGKPKIYKPGEIDKARYMRENLNIWNAHLKNKVYYESLQAQSMFFAIYDI